MGNEKVFDVYCIEITFEIPEWFPQDRFDYTKSDKACWNIVYGNKAEDQFFKRFPECRVIQKNAWVTFRFEGACSGDHLHHWIRYIKQKMYKFFKRYKEWDSEYESKWVNTISLK